MRPWRKKSVKPTANPKWDAATHTLFWWGKPVHHFRHEASHEEELLEAFEKAGWTDCLQESCLPGKIIKSKSQLRGTVKSLNKNLKRVLHFRLEGSGARVCWEPAKRGQKR
jgi:hypothetical protein